MPKAYFHCYWVVEYIILVDHLSLWYGAFGGALSWFTSDLSGRQQSVNIGNCFRHHLICHVVFVVVQFWDL